MENNAFLEKYFAEKNREKQLSILKNYMLSLPADKLKNFILEPLDFLEKALKNSKVSSQQKKEIFAHLDKMIFLMQGKSRAAASSK